MLKKIPRVALIIALASSVTFSNLILSGCAEAQQQESTGQYVDGSVTTAKIKAKFVADQYLKSLPITVKTYKGTVQLSGFVDSDAQKHRAEMIARSFPEVSEVDNALVIKKQ